MLRYKPLGVVLDTFAVALVLWLSCFLVAHSLPGVVALSFFPSIFCSVPSPSPGFSFRHLFFCSFSFSLFFSFHLLFCSFTFSLFFPAIFFSRSSLSPCFPLPTFSWSRHTVLSTLEFSFFEVGGDTSRKRVRSTVLAPLVILPHFSLCFSFLSIFFYSVQSLSPCFFPAIFFSALSLSPRF